MEFASGKKRVDDAGTPASGYDKQLLLATIHRINKSFEKKLMTGFEYRSDGRLQPVVRLLGGTFSGVTFTVEAWDRFLEDFQEIRRYFRASDEESRTMQDQRIASKTGISVAFTSAYGQRAILVESRHQQCVQRDAKRVKTTETYRPSVVMQRVTYEHLEDISECVTAKLKYLDSITDAVNLCKTVLTDKIRYECERMNKSISEMETVDIRLLRATLLESVSEDYAPPVVSEFSNHEVTMLVFELLTLFANRLLNEIVDINSAYEMLDKTQQL